MPGEGDTQEKQVSPVSYGVRVRAEGRTGWGSSGGGDSARSKGLTEGEVREEENSCGSKGAETPRESAPAGQWVQERE